MLFPIRQLIEDREKPLCISRALTVSDALSLMIEHDYSQLPVLDDAGKLIGIISEKSITNTYFNSGGNVPIMPLKVDNCLAIPRIVKQDEDVLNALNILKEVDSLLIVEDDKPVGIITNFDTTNFFRNLSEGLIIIEDIESALNELIDSEFPTDAKKLDAWFKTFGKDEADDRRPARDPEKPSFEDLLRVITKHWSSFENMDCEKNLFLSILEPVREIRNQLAHFRGDLSPLQQNRLHHARDWMYRKVQNRARAMERKVSNSESTVTTSDQPLNEIMEESEDINLYKYLISKHISTCALKISEIENIMKQKLPESARVHRSWWANDYGNQVQSRAWLEAGYLVKQVDLEQEEVVFTRSKSARYQGFFTKLLDELKINRPGLTQKQKVSSQSWLPLSSGKSHFTFYWAFKLNGKFAVELFMESPDQEFNKRAFDWLSQQKEEIEKKMGEKLNWDRLNNKKGSRISIITSGDIGMDLDSQRELRKWAASMMVKFFDVFKPYIFALPFDE